MLRMSFLPVALAALLASASPATAGGLFPPNVIEAGGGHRFTERLGEARWWDPTARGRPEQGIRMFVGGFTLKSWSIRLEQAPGGRWRGHFREHDPRRLTRDKPFTVRREDLADLQALTAKAGLWEIYPQFWQGPENDICLDGETLIFERLDSAGYRYSHGVQPCTLSRDQMAVAEKLALMAGEPELAAMFR